MERQPEVARHQLAGQILELIRDARLEIGTHLGEQFLGNLLEVSRTPVRAALTLLAEHGVVEARRNRGFFLVRSPQSLNGVAIVVPSTMDQMLYDRMVRDRLEGALPDSFSQAEISQRYGLDRAVVVQTIARLAHDGLVTRRKGYGWRFLPTLDNRSALRGSYEFRTAVEPAAILFRSFRVDGGVLDKIRMKHIRLEASPNFGAIDGSEFFEIDAAFHEMIAEFSGNLFVLHAVQQQNRLRRLFEFGTYSNRKRVREWLREHLNIMEALAAPDVTRASALMEDHIANARLKALL